MSNLIEKKASEYTLIPYILYKYYGITEFNLETAKIIEKNPKTDLIIKFLSEIKFYNKGKRKGDSKGLSKTFSASKINMNYVFPFNLDDGKIILTEHYQKIFDNISYFYFKDDVPFFVFDNEKYYFDFLKILNLKNINAKLLDGKNSFKNKSVSFLIKNNVLLEENLNGDNKTIKTGTRSIATKNYLIVNKNNFNEDIYESVNNDRFYIKLEDVFNKDLSLNENLENNIINKINKNGIINHFFEKYPEKYNQLLKPYLISISKKLK